MASKNLQFEFDDAMNKARFYVENPAVLRTEIDTQDSVPPGQALQLPRPDAFTYRMTRYRGFVRFPERLINYLKVEAEGRSAAHKSLPTNPDIEPNSRCNFRCNMCCVSEWPGGKRADDFKYDDFVTFLES